MLTPHLPSRPSGGNGGQETYMLLTCRPIAWLGLHKTGDPSFDCDLSPALRAEEGVEGLLHFVILLCHTE